MRWLHVFSTFAIGGPQVRAAQLMELGGPGIEHRIVAMDGRSDCLARLAPGVRAALVPAPPKGGFLATGKAFRALLAEERPDLLLTYNWGAIEALLGAKLAGFRNVVHHEDGFGPEEANGLFRRRTWMRRLLFGAARTIVVPSQNLERIARSTWWQKGTKVVYLPNGVDLQRFHPGPALARSPLVVGCVGAFRGEKNQAMLLRAFALCRQRARARLVLVGDGPDLAACRALAGELGIADVCEFRGATNDTAPHYRDFDVFAMSSRTEQMPLVLLEAMASGLPVAAPAVGDIEQMVCDRNRPFIVPFVQAEALAVALDALLADDALRAEIGAANRARCEEHFERAACYGRFLAAYG